MNTCGTLQYDEKTSEWRLNDRRVNCGTCIELKTELGWLPIRFELTRFRGKRNIPSLHFDLPIPPRFGLRAHRETHFVIWDLRRSCVFDPSELDVDWRTSTFTDQAAAQAVCDDAEWTFNPAPSPNILLIGPALLGQFRWAE